jgi:hypothetical protein
MATTPKRPKPYSWAVDRELITLAKTLSLETIVKRTGRKSETVLKMAERLDNSRSKSFVQPGSFSDRYTGLPGRPCRNHCSDTGYRDHRERQIRD